MTAASRCLASTPCEMYMAMMPPETCAMPLVMMVISSLRVALDRNGRMVSGASVWPMKMRGGHVHAFGAGDAHGLQHDPRHAANDDLHQPDVIEHGEKCRDEDDGGQHLKREDGRRTRARSALPNAPALGRPSSPNRMRVPAKVADSMLLTTSPAHAMARCPKSKRSTKNAKMTCRLESPGHGAPANAPAVRRAQPRRQQHGQNPQHSRKSIQSDLSFGQFCPAPV